MIKRIELQKVDGLQNAWFVVITKEDGREGVYGRAIKPPEGDVTENPDREPWFHPAPGRMVLRAEELEAIADILRTAPELRA